MVPTAKNTPKYVRDKLVSRRKLNKTGIPEYVIDSLARALLPAIQAYFASEEGQREFVAWQAEHHKQRSNIKNSKDL